jgi:hypothetical protein
MVFGKKSVLREVVQQLFRFIEWMVPLSEESAQTLNAVKALLGTGR